MTDVKKKRSLKRRIEKVLKKGLIWIAKYTVPYFYFGYMKIVWATSSVYDESQPRIMEDLVLPNPRHKFVTVLWHQDVFGVPWAFRQFSPHTITSVGDAGEVFSRMLKLCTFTVFRGGSSHGKSRKTKVLDDFTEHLQKADKAAVGITVDGASGPVYRMKTGMLVVATKMQIPIMTVRIWAKRRFFLPTWDRTMVPLPFNKIVILIGGPYLPPPSLEEEGALERYQKEVEVGLCDLAYRGFMMVDGKPHEKFVSMFPEHWSPKEIEK